MTTRPKRAALKRRLTELSVRKLKPEPAPYLIWDTLATRAGDPGAAHRRPGLEGDLQPPRPPALAASRRRRRHRAGRRPHAGGRGDAGGRPRARTRRPRSGRSAAPGPSPSWPPSTSRRTPRSSNKSWRQADYAGPPLPAAALGQAAGRQSSPAPTSRPLMGHIEAPVLANQVLAAASARSSAGQ